MNFANALGWTLVHFLWEGALIAALFAIGQILMRRASSDLRYVTGCAAMFAMLAAPVFTLVLLGKQNSRIAGAASNAAERGSHFSDCFPVLIGIWVAGVV